MTLRRIDDSELASVLERAATAQGFSDFDLGSELSRPQTCSCGQPAASTGLRCNSCEKAHILSRRRAIAVREWKSVPKELAALSFGSKGLDAWVHDKAAIARAALALDSSLVTLIGPAGAGKTSIAVAMLAAHVRVGLRPEATRDQWRRAETAHFTRAYELAEAAEAHPLGRGMAPALERARRSFALVVDELSTRRDPGEAVGSLLHARHASGRTTIVTTWMDRAKVVDTYGGGIARRLFDDGLVIPVSAAPGA